MSACPICQQPVDSLRARHVGVIDGKIVAFCSAACQARAAEAGAGARVAAKAAAAPEPAPEGKRKRARTPPAGVQARTPPAGVPVVAPPVVAEAAPAAAPRVPEKRMTPAALAAAAAPGETAGSDDPSASSIRRSRRRKDSLDARAGFEWIDDEPAEPVGPRGRRADSEGEGEDRRGRGRLIAVIVLLAVLGGGGYLAYRRAYPPRGGAVSVPPPPADAIVADAPPTPEQQRASAIERAITVLRGHAAAPAAPAAPAAGAAPGSAAGSSAPKEGTAGEEALARRMAAGALARTGDAAAIALLAELLEKEPSESARLEISYHLARAGDARGQERLVAALTHRNLDHRHEAARWLARLGDQRAVPVLTSAMAYGQFRLQAAEVLAHVADPGAIKALEDIRGAPGANADEKARATIALGRVKRAGADELRALLNDKRNAEAAPVLLENGDAAARPILHLQLALEHFCVEAARALRRFGDETDRADGLRTLLGALGGGGPTAQIRAAEAILVLAGPERWSERM